MSKYYCREKRCLVYLTQPATPNYWDTHWETSRSTVQPLPRRSLIVSTTKRFLASQSRILEGGCGSGLHLRSLSHAGFTVTGVDYAPLTVSFLQQQFPSLTVLQHDIRDLPFADSTFHGYWSIGVIEHFWSGYTSIVTEAFRVLQPGSYLFLSFPSLSLLRRLKILLRLYPHLPSDQTSCPPHFYQFALDPISVSDHCQQLGFSLISSLPYDGLKGLKDEISFLKPLLQPVYDSRTVPSKVLQYLFNLVFSPLTNHSTILVLRKNLD